MIKKACSRKEEPILALRLGLALSGAALLVTLGLPAHAQMQLVPGISTVAGNGTAGSTGDGGAASSAELNLPAGVTFDSAGNYYIAEFDGNRVREVTSASGIITTVAGTGTAGYSGDGGQATSAQLHSPNAVALDGAGNLYIAEYGNNRIRKVTVANGVITTVAGNGTAGYSGDGGQATSAELNAPTLAVVDGAGNIYIADRGNSRIRKVTVATGVITTAAGNGVAGYSGDGGQATSAELNLPQGIALDGSGNLYIADSSNNRIREANISSGVITTVAGNGTGGYAGDNGGATSAEISGPYDVALDSAGNFYLSDGGNFRIRKVNIGSGIITTVAGDGTIGDSGDGGTAMGAELNAPVGMAFDGAGNLYFADINNNVVRRLALSTTFASTAVGSSSAAENFFLQATSAETLTSIIAGQSQGSKQEYGLGAITGCTVNGSTSNASGTVCTVPITFSPAYPGVRNVPLSAVTGAGTVKFGLSGTGLGPLAAMTPGIISTVAGNGTAGETGNGGASISAELNGPNRLAVDSAGNIYIADSVGNVIRKVAAATGFISTVAGNGNSTYSGDGGAATSAGMNPNGVEVDGAGNIYIADFGNGRVRKVTAATGIISTFAGNGIQGFSGDGGLATNAKLNSPAYVVLDNAGDIYIADYNNNRIRKVSAATGIITTIAGNGTRADAGDGGAATSAELNGPVAVAIDASGNFYIAEYMGSRIRKVTSATGIIATVAGNGTGGASGDGGVAISAELNIPQGLALDAAANLYIADGGNNRIRKVDNSTQIITTVAGNGTAGYSGDGGAATSAELSSSNDIALDSAGKLYVADRGNNVVREVDVSQSALTYPTSTAAGTTDSSDDPQVIWVENIGNGSLTISTPMSGTNPSVAAYFELDSSTTCPQLTPSSSAQTLASGEDCIYAVDFAPTVAGSISGSLALTDTSLNVAGTTQTASLSGTAGSVGTTTTVSSSANPSTYPAAVTLTATVAVSSGSDVPSGTVQFNIDGSSVGGAVTLSSGVGTYSASTLTAGTHSVKSVYSTSSSSFTGSTSSTLSQVLNKATPTITWTPPVAIPYGTALSGAQLNATASVAGTFVYSPASGTVPGAGSQTLNVTFTPTDTTDYNSNTASLTLTVNKTTPTLTWATPAAIPYGTALSSTQLDATTTPAGTFAYSPTGGTVLGAGSQTLSVIFTPTDTTDYNSTPASVTLTVNKATPTLMWSTPSAISYGTALSATQLDATASVPGTFVYSPASGTVLTAGSQTLSVTFAPTDTVDYNNASTSMALAVNKAMPTLMWSTPSAINYGTALSATQLNATASVPGTFAYSPVTGTVLGAGSQTLSVTFTPTNFTDYNSASTTMALTINKASPTITWATPLAIPYGTALSGTQLNATAGTPGTFVYSPVSGTVLGVGSQALNLTFTPTNTTDYNANTASVTLMVNKATPTITWANPAAITYGSALSAMQLNATASVAGTLSYSPGSGTILAAGSQTLNVTLTPIDSTDYNSKTASVHLVVSRAAPTLTWATPAAVSYGTALSSTQLDATASLAGTLVYSPAAGTVVGIGPQTLGVNFTPTDSTDYNPASTTTTLIVNKAAPRIAWANPAAIPYGTALAGKQLNATASTAGSFLYLPAAGAVLSAGSQTLSVTFAPTNSTDYLASSATVNLTVKPATLTAIIVGNPTKPYDGSRSATLAPSNFSLSGLIGSDAIAVTQTAGTYAAASAGAQEVTATLIPSKFTPLGATILANYILPGVANGPGTIAKAPLTAQANDATRLYGTANPRFAGTVSGQIPGDSFTETFSSPAVISSAVGGYAIVPALSGNNLGEYAVMVVNGTVSVTKAASATNLAASSSTLAAGQPVTLTAAATSTTTGTPTSNVRFLDGTTVLGIAALNGGVATYAVTLSPGVHSISADYAGDSNFTASSAKVSISVTASPQQDFTFALASGSASSQTVAAGSAMAYNLVAAPLGSQFPGSVTFTLKGLPGGASYTFSPSTLAAASGSSSITLTVRIPTRIFVQSARRWPFSQGRSRLPLLLGVIWMPWAGYKRMRRQTRRQLRFLPLLLALMMLPTWTGCGATNTLNGPAQPQTHVLTATASSGPISHSVTLILVVNE